MWHTPVMELAAVAFLLENRGRCYVDATTGTGGHTERILKLTPGNVKVIGIDRDRGALELAGQRLCPFGDRVMLICGNFRNIQTHLGHRACDGFLVDLGLSSYQIADGERGFSYLADGPLDMAMGADSRSVSELLATAGEREIGSIIRRYGEERRYRAIASEIVHLRDTSGMTGAADLRSAVERVVRSGDRIASLSRVFQAFRIWANEELDALKEFLDKAVELLDPGGRLVVISYHSLEDRIVKRFFRMEEKGCTCPPDFPECACGRTPRLRRLTRRVKKPSAEEVQRNPRSRSARLRAAERI